MEKTDKNLLNSGNTKPIQHTTGGLRVVNPAVLVGLGMLAAGTAAPVQAGPAADDSYTTSINTPVTGVNVTTNDSIEGNTYSVMIVTPPAPASGTATLTPEGLLTFTPAPGFSGTATLLYALGEEFPDSNSAATVTITVAAPAPVTAVPALAPLAVGGLGALVALLGARRRVKKED
ncbi:Ig-like domain-containing protein [Ottowia thiooxydans]|uniref:Uncharacterized protein n=1 Tax=Ottowia thiooxydans TaxID=219182 RepID=A0ABV2Q449_9BURK